MRIFLFSFSMFILANAFGQLKVTYDKKVIEKYNRAFEHLPAKFREFEKKFGNSNDNKVGLVIVEAVIDDTLNLNQFTPIDTSIKISHIDGSPFKVDTSKIDDNVIMLVFGTLNSGTLDIQVTPWLMSSQTIQHTVIKNKVRSTYSEYYKRDSILRTNNSETATNDMLIPAKTIKFVLSGKKIVPGKDIYGEAEVITDDFFYLAAYGFKDYTLKHRLHYKYLFKFKPDDGKTNLSER